VYTHRINFYSNVVRVVVEHGVIVKTDDDSICPCCYEPIAGYWLVDDKQALCPSADCNGGNFPLTILRA